MGKDAVPEVEVLKLYPFEIPHRSQRLLAYADVRIGSLLIIKSIKLLKNRYGGLYIQMPDVYKEGRTYPLVEITSRELSELIRRRVVDNYNRIFGKS
jgi:stage V sporulation protein G